VEKRRDTRVGKRVIDTTLHEPRLVQLLNMYTGQQDVDSNGFSSADAKCWHAEMHPRFRKS
jgi:hypothetical protein